MMAITLLKPNGWSVLHSGKRVVNRSSLPPEDIMTGGRFALHSGKGVDDVNAITCAIADFWTEDRDFDGMFATCRLDRIVTGKDELPKDQRRWFDGPFGWVLWDLFFFDPIPCRGHQGMWTVPPEVLSRMPAFKECRP